jgi:histidinol dehydrogenase
MSLMKIFENPAKDEWNKILARPAMNNYRLEEAVLNVLEQVKQHGDEAVSKFTRDYDGVFLENFKVKPEEIAEAESSLSPQIRKSITSAIANIEKFHRSQLVVEKAIETMPGVKLWQKAVPIDKVGLYIPGGTAPLFSTLLMLGIPAKIAGCSQIVICTPPNKDGKVHPAILYSAKVIGLTNVFKIGGVQAIGAMAYGTESVPSVYKIFGPGNQYVTAAKQVISREGIAIDMPAGPSEVMVVADYTAVPSFVASDLLSQAEHGVDSQVVLVTRFADIVKPVMDELSNQLETLPRKEIASKALEFSRVVVLSSDEEIIDLVNEYAPEHLILATSNAVEMSTKVLNAGSVFLGNFSPESAGDYASGTNHTLPTSGYAKMYGGVNMDSFLKKVTYQQITEYGLFNLGPAVMEMAAIEDLDGHRRAVKIRMDSLKTS